ncbi:hypothetical protein LINGRAPRIM_LOCUS952 [Linum grandiflorum]
MPISTHLQLKSSSAPHHHLDKAVVLRRIRQHRSLKWLRNSFQTLNSDPYNNNLISLQPNDAFSSP